MNPVKPIAYLYGAYKGTSVLFGDSTLRGTPGDIVNTVGNISALGLIAGYGLSRTYQEGKTFGAHYGNKFEQWSIDRSKNVFSKYKTDIFDSALKKNKITKQEIGEFYKVFSGEKGSIFDMYRQATRLSSKGIVGTETALSMLKESALNRAGRWGKSAIELATKYAPKSLGGMAVTAGALLIGSMFAGSLMDRAFGARRRY